MAEHLGRGATKYGDRNWERGYQWSLSYAALQRHLNAFWSGEDYDPEFPDSHHLDAAMFHVMALREFSEKYPQYDNRPVNRETFGETQTDRPTTGKAAKDQRATSFGRDSEIQTSRWEVP